MTAIVESNHSNKKRKSSSTPSRVGSLDAELSASTITPVSKQKIKKEKVAANDEELVEEHADASFTLGEENGKKKKKKIKKEKVDTNDEELAEEKIENGKKKKN